MKQFLALYFLFLFATIALPIRAMDCFSNDIVEEEVVSKNKAIIHRMETFCFINEFLSAPSNLIFHYHHSVAFLTDPSFSVIEQPPNDKVW